MTIRIIVTAKHKEAAAVARRRASGLKSMRKMQRQNGQADVSAGQYWGGVGARQVAATANGRAKAEAQRKSARAWKR